MTNYGTVKEIAKMTTAIEVYDPLPVCEECGKSYTGLNDAVELSLYGTDQNGEYREDGTWIGYDYVRQVWIDTSPAATRDSSYFAGSACNPLQTRCTVYATGLEAIPRGEAMTMKAAEIRRGDIVRFQSYALRVEATPLEEKGRIVLTGRISIDGCPTVTKRFLRDLQMNVERTVTP